VLLENCAETVLDGFHLRGQTNRLASAICFRITIEHRERRAS
jgi:hypothetical protein